MILTLVTGRWATAGAGDCWEKAERNGALCYKLCKDGYKGVGPVCWQRCPQGYTDDGATCRKDAHITGANNKDCPWYDKCGLTLKKGCSKCPPGYKNDGCTCRKDVHIFGKDSYGRGAGYLLRGGYRSAFHGYISSQRNIWMPSAKPLTAAQKAFLKPFFPERLINGVRILENLGMTGAFIHSARGTTFGKDLIVFKKGHWTLDTLKHEFVHVCQYDKHGEGGFAHLYADNYVDSGYDYTQMAFELEAKAFVPKNEHISKHLLYCDK
jgi:hypothetical protein